MTKPFRKTLKFPRFHPFFGDSILLYTLSLLLDAFVYIVYVTILLVDIRALVIYK